MLNNYIIHSDGSFISEDELYHHGIKGMKWGVRMTPKLSDEMKKRYETYKRNLTSEQRKEYDSQVEVWRKNAKKRKNPMAKFNWGDLGKDYTSSGDSMKGNFKIWDYYSRNAKSFIEDHNDLYLSQWTRNLEKSGINYKLIGRKYIEGK